jgi:putative membrane protein
MQIIRTIVWITITAVLVAFVAMNWDQAPVNFWPLDNGAYLHLQWPVGLIAIFFFLLGATPVWLLSQAGKWRMNRRLAALENSVRAVTPTPPQTAQPDADAGYHPRHGTAGTADHSGPAAGD